MNPLRLPPPESVGKADVRWLDEQTGRAWLASGTDAFRLAESGGLRFERFGAVGLLSSQTSIFPSEFLQAVLAHPLAAGISNIYHRMLVHSPGEENAPSLVRGDPKKARFPAREDGLAYWVDFSAGYSCGLFLDQRVNRGIVRESRPSRLLNCFAYTCSFSVAAASVGSLTTSVDLSKRSLQRGRENFSANDLSDKNHRFISEDVFRYLPRLSRRGERFDAILLDPPTFSRSKTGGVFRVESDMARLLELALACAAPQARILISSNCSRLSLNALKNLVGVVCPHANNILTPPACPGITLGANTLWFSTPE